jgi:DNA helicase HerA-like ATPase
MIYPFEASRFIGTVVEADPANIHINLRHATDANDSWQFGKRFGFGRVGEFIVIECEELGIVGRITKIEVPERDRGSIEDRVGVSQVSASPLGYARLLTTISLQDEKPLFGIQRIPRIGSRVYSLLPEVLRDITEKAQRSSSSNSSTKAIKLPIGTLEGDNDVTLSISAKELFGRHLAIVGATGGGKSYTLARLLEEVSHFNSKCILIDATGEYHRMSSRVSHSSLGRATDEATGCKDCWIPYQQLDEQDLIALFKPSVKSQLPKLREAMRSLKLASLVPSSSIVHNGCIIKPLQQKQPIEDALRAHSTAIYQRGAQWNIKYLAQQIAQECCSTDQYNPTKYSKANETDFGYCSSLLGRIDSALNDRDFDCIFDGAEKHSLFDEIEAFLIDPKTSTLRISLKYLSFAFNLREVVVNAIGRFLLEHGRLRTFVGRPLLVLVDEAHQFLNKSVGDEESRYDLNAFELIAKEGRKYSLNLCLSTQRPRDVPEGILSQVGTFIVHRLTNHADREIIERASSDLDRSASTFLPTLGEGQALLIGVDFPLPLPIQVNAPSTPPQSESANFNLWESNFKCERDKTFDGVTLERLRSESNNLESISSSPSVSQSSVNVKLTAEADVDDLPF